MIRRSAREVLNCCALRATTGRVRILDLLRKSSTPLSVAGLHDRLGADRPDLVTVYRTVERFVERSIVRTVRLADGIRRYEIADRGHHHHLTCTSCGRVEDLPFCRVAPLERLAWREHRFKVTEHMLELFGTCQRCTSDRR